MEVQPCDFNLLEPLASNAEWIHVKSARVRWDSPHCFVKFLIAWLHSFFSMINLVHNRGWCWEGWMSYDEECLPAPVLATQQSGHDMMPIIISLPFDDVMSNTDDFLVSVPLTDMCIEMYTYPCRCLFFWRSRREERRKEFNHIYSLFNCC